MAFVRAVVGILALDFSLQGTFHCLVQDLISSLGFDKVKKEWIRGSPLSCFQCFGVF